MLLSWWCTCITLSWCLHELHFSVTADPVKRPSFISLVKLDCIDCFHDPIMQHVLGGSLHKNNTSCLLLGLYHASLNWLSIGLMQIPPKMNCIMWSVKKANGVHLICISTNKEAQAHHATGHQNQSKLGQFSYTKTMVNVKTQTGMQTADCRLFECILYFYYWVLTVNRVFQANHVIVKVCNQVSLNITPVSLNTISISLVTVSSQSWKRNTIQLKDYSLQSTFYPWVGLFKARLS